MYDWQKLLRSLGLIKKTINDPMYIGVNTLKKLYSWVDASYAVHDDIRSRTSGVTSFGRCGVCAKSSKKKNKY